MVLGCIADDFTGATDLANTLTRRGRPTILMIAVSKAVSPEAHPIVVIVVALKSRAIPADQAVALITFCSRWLMRATAPGKGRILFAAERPSRDRYAVLYRQEDELSHARATIERTQSKRTCVPWRASFTWRRSKPRQKFAAI